MGNRGELQDRWTPEHLRRVNRDLLRSGGELPVGEVVEGEHKYRDLRGVQISEILRRVQWAWLDFSSCRTVEAGQFVDVELTDCLLREAIIDTNISGRFRRCDFSSAVLRGTSFRGGTFEDCRFSDSDLRKTMGKGLLFRRCDLSRAKLRGASFYDSVFEDCLWAGVTFGHGSLAGSVVRGGDFQAVDLKDTVTEGLQVEHVGVRGPRGA